LAGDCAADASDNPGVDAAPVDDACLTTEDDTAGLHALEGRRVLIDLADEGAHLGRIQATQAPNVAGGAWRFPVVFDDKVTEVFDLLVIKGLRDFLYSKHTVPVGVGVQLARGI
jgi:hypothetical protein